jgi:methylenetetrahydrofolate reductase (NADPH)
MMSPPTVSFEIFPPGAGAPESRLCLALDRLQTLDPAYVSVTYGAGGTSFERAERSGRIMHELLGRGRLKPAAHLTCVGASRDSIDAIARQWHGVGVRRIIALRGDMPQTEARFQPHVRGYADAAELVAGLRRIADFDISVGAYPECHPDSPSLEADLDNLKRKLDAGATRAITQFFFDADVFLRFRDRVTRAGIAAPLIPGIMPITNFSRIRAFSRRCGASIPDWVAQRFDGLDENPESRDLVSASTVGSLCERLRAEGVDAFHFYTLNRASLTYAACRLLGL